MANSCWTFISDFVHGRAHPMSYWTTGFAAAAMLLMLV